MTTIDLEAKVKSLSTKTFGVFWDRLHREASYGISICAGNGDGLYALNKTELRELQEVVNLAIKVMEDVEGC